MSELIFLSISLSAPLKLGYNLLKTTLETTREDLCGSFLYLFFSYTSLRLLHEGSEALGRHWQVVVPSHVSGGEHVL